jgi:hypothetical protein
VENAIHHFPVHHHRKPLMKVECRKPGLPRPLHGLPELQPQLMN